MRKAKKFITLWISLCITICMMLVMSVTAFAGENSLSSGSPDYTKKGSITVDICSTDTKKPIPGGTVTLYQVAFARQTDGENTFVLTDDFRESKANLESISEMEQGTKELAAQLETYAVTKKLEGQSVTVDQKGQAKWSSLELGLYLVVNTTPAKGYEAITSFLITVPRYLNGAYVYDIQAEPKVGTANTAVDKTPALTVTPEPASVGSKLPQTGQLWWPVPVFAFLGVLFVMLGWYQRRRFGGKCSGC